MDRRDFIKSLFVTPTLASSAVSKIIEPDPIDQLREALTASAGGTTLGYGQPLIPEDLSTEIAQIVWQREYNRAYHPIYSKYLYKGRI